MLVSVQHKSTVCKDGNATYAYTIQDESGMREVKFSMPLSLVVMGGSLTTIALHQAYYKQGREVVAQALDEHYAILSKEGMQDARNLDIAFYRKALS
jgi:hypothetical protein